MKSLKNLTTILFLTAGITFFSGNTFSQDSSQIKSHAQMVKEHEELTERINKTFAKYEIDDLESDAYLKYLDKDYDGAIQKYLEYLKLRPKDAEAYDNLAECYSAIGQSKKSIEYYSKSTNLNPDAFIYHKIAGQYEKLNSLEEAHKNLDKAILINPKEDLYYRYKELLYQKQGKTKEAKEILEEGLKNNPDCEELKLSLEFTENQLESEEDFLELDALIASIKGNDKESIDMYDKLIKLSPDNAEYYLLRGQSKISLVNIFNPYANTKYSLSAIKDFKKVKKMLAKDNEMYKKAIVSQDHAKNAFWTGSATYAILFSLIGLSIYAIRRVNKKEKEKIKETYNNNS